jgi:hypothetical protein
VIAVALILAGVVVGVTLGFVRGGWWAVWAAAALVGAVAWVAQDAWTALAYAVATAAGVGIGVAVRRRGPRSVPPPG